MNMRAVMISPIFIKIISSSIQHVFHKMRGTTSSGKDISTNLMKRDHWNLTLNCGLIVLSFAKERSFGGGRFILAQMRISSRERDCNHGNE